MGDTQSRPVAIPLVVDMDGTLLRTDTLQEGLVAYVSQNPFRLFRVLGWIARGKMVLKERVSTHAPLDSATLPVNERVLEYVRHQRGTGRAALLVTGAAHGTAQSVFEVVGEFDEVITTSPINGNLSGDRKATYLVNRFGAGGYSYIGDSRKDMAIWRAAHDGVAVDAGYGIRRELKSLSSPMVYFNSPRADARTWVKQLRLHQAAKNVLILAPLVLAHQFLDAPSLLRGTLMLIAFTCLSCGTYIWNDLHDLAADRSHPTKKNRPLAAGLIPIHRALAVAGALLVSAFAISASLGWDAVAILLVYLVTTVSYSSFFKRVIVADVIVLAALYTVRIFAGAIAVHVSLSIWVILTSVFLFFSLALMKRYSEFVKYEGTQLSGRGYQYRDRGAILAFGVASSLVTVLVIGLYVDSDAVRVLYATPEILWAVIPLVLYWVTRLWILTERGDMNDDPVAFTLTDRVSQVVLLATATVVVAATLIGR